MTRRRRGFRELLLFCLKKKLYIIPLGQRVKHILLVLVTLIVCTNVSMANHILGGEVSYKYIKNSEYKIFVKVYRDCQECKLGTYGGGTNTTKCPDITSLEIRNALNGSVLTTVALNRDGYKDITPVCSSAGSACSNNSTINYGIEEHSFSVTVDLASYKTTCNFEFGLKMFSRSKTLDNQTFYNYARLDLCGGQHNNSTQFSAAPLQVLYLSEETSYNLEAKDEDGDSLSYQLSKALKDYDKSMTYTTGFSEKKPLNVLGSISFSEESGQLTFTPNKLDDIGVFVLEVTEWRRINGKMEAIGVTRRDVQFLVINSPGNDPPKLINTERSYSVCAGEELCVDYNAQNNSTGPNYDSVYFSCNSPIKNYRFYIHKFKVAPYYGSTFCWSTTSKRPKPSAML